MKNCTTHPTPAVGVEPHFVRSRISIISVAAAMSLATFGGNAYALGFGRMQVHSALGQPLRAEVELTDAQAANLKAGLASATVYQEKGLDYSPRVKSIRTSLRRSPNGKTFLQLSSDSPMNDPFIDVVLQANDGSGSVTRDFSILLDPPNTPRAPVAVVAPAAGVRVTPPPPPRERVALPSADVPVVDSDERIVARKKGRSKQVAGSVRVRRGTTAGAIAAANRPARVSLDQMLIALLRSNSHAFINGNVNHLRSGVVLKMPTAQQARAVSAAEARTLVIAQSEDFRNYRHQLAKSSMAQATPNAQQSSGKVQTQVVDGKSSPTTSPDQLTISGAGAVGKQQTKEERIAKALESKEKSSRAEELNKNLKDLKNISADAASGPQGGSKAKPGTAPAIVVPAPPVATTPPAQVAATSSAPTAPAASSPKEMADAAVVAAAKASQAAVTAAQAASTAASAASTAVVAASTAASNAPAPLASQPVKPASAPRKKVAPPPPPPAPSFFEELTSNPLMLGGLAAAVLGGGAYALIRSRKRRKHAEDANSSFLESNFTPDSFFHASGGKEVDTSETTAGHTDANQSSMLYSPSQLDAEADVDPVSEADVYLAYGRDIQAEEILKDALLKHPGRIPVYAKLLEIYARRRDLKGYAQAAAELKQLSNASGIEWDTARAKGAELDPGNPLYAKTPVAPVAPAANTVAAAAVPVSAPPVSMPSLPVPPAGVQPVVAAPPVPPVPVAPAAPMAGAATAAVAAASAPGVRSDLLKQPSVSPTTIPVTINTPSVGANPRDSVSPIDLSLDLPDLNAQAIAPASLSSVSAASVKEEGLDFDMSGLSLDLDPPAAPASVASDGMSTKLALAREFISIGDKESARTMVQEVAQHATGDLKAQAEALLHSIR